MNGKMEECFKEIGELVKWMGKVYLNGLMVELILGNTFKISNMVKEHLNGQMAKNGKEGGH